MNSLDEFNFRIFHHVPCRYGKRSILWFHPTTCGSFIWRPRQSRLCWSTVADARIQGELTSCLWNRHHRFRDTVLPILKVFSSNVSIFKGDKQPEARGVHKTQKPPLSDELRISGNLSMGGRCTNKTLALPQVVEEIHLTTKDGPVVRAPLKTRPMEERFCFKCTPIPLRSSMSLAEGGKSRYALHYFLRQSSKASTSE